MGQRSITAEPDPHRSEANGGAHYETHCVSLMVIRIARIRGNRIEQYGKPAGARERAGAAPLL